MARFYGKATKFIRHAPSNAQYVIEPQRLMHIPFWYADPSKTADSDGSDVTGINMRLGSIVTKHKVEMTVTPETVDPQNVYMGVIKLSFHDIHSPFVCGKNLKFTAYQTAGTLTNQTSYIRIWNDDTVSGKSVYQTGQIDPSGIQTVQLDDNFPHFVSKLKKFTVFNQQPLVTSRWMKVPSKVRRINPNTYYGLWVFNDAPRGGTPADTQVTFDVKQYFEEFQI